MKNEIQKGSNIGLILGGILILLLIIYSPIKMRLNICHIIGGIICGVFLCLINCIITLFISKKYSNYLYRRTEGVHRFALTKAQTYLSFVADVFVEELLLRSYLFSFICLSLGKFSAIFATTVLFIILHSKPRIIELGLMGITFGVLVIITNNIITPIMAHLSINLIYLGYKYKKNKKTY